MSAMEAATAAAPSVLRSYGGLREARPREVVMARDTDAIAALFARAEREGRRVTVRAAGRSFDDQAMNDDTVVDVSAMRRIVALDVVAQEITVEPGASWGEIVAHTLPHGLLPHILVTTPWATAGGTLSANCISRSTPRYGHTGEHVRSLELLTVGGQRVHCARDCNAELFHAVVGGFGYFGVVTRITYDLLAIGARQRVRTVIDRREGLPDFVAHLTDVSQNPGTDDAVSSVLSLASPQRGAVVRSTYTDEPLGKPLFLHQPWTWYRPLAEVLFASSAVGNAVCHASYKYVFGGGPFVDDLHGYTFCMEGNERMKALTARVGLRLRTVQPSFAVPTESTLFFLGEAARLMREADVYPSLLDALYRPSDGFLLSSANGLPGFCVSFLFEAVTAGKYRRLAPCLLALNDACLAAGGRLHLIKNVHATRAQLGAMYAHAAGDLARIKARVDPRGVLVNDFFARAFG
jgi:decaprenylphospho-beta-D-ribofuranose 2-oxidase